MLSKSTAISVTTITKYYPKKRGTGWKLFKDALLRNNSYSQSESNAALKEVSFEVASGETVGIIGKNGSGKSTLLQIICGTLQPTSGRCSTNGRIAALLELGAGFNPEFTGRENIRLNASMLGMSHNEIERKLPAIVEFADIGKYIDEPVRTYSSGMYVRLGFAVIANVDADILVIDEALAVGDAFFTQKCMRFLRQFMKKGTVLFVSHDPGTVTNLCQRAVWLESGEVKMIGDAKSVSEAYFAAGYGAELKRLDPSNSTHSESHVASENTANIDPVGIRESVTRGTAYENCLKIFSFAPESSFFGVGGVQIILATLENPQKQTLATVYGGEVVLLRIVAIALRQIKQPIVGFSLRDRLGQPLFGENTFLVTYDKPTSVEQNEKFEACFRFRFPILPVGDYVFNIAIANGTQTDHEQLIWVNDAIAVRSLSSSVSTGLIGLPMHDIILQKIT